MLILLYEVDTRHMLQSKFRYILCFSKLRMDLSCLGYTLVRAIMNLNNGRT